MTPVLMIFIDGVGIGSEDRESNPFFIYGFKAFEHYFGGIPSDKNPVLVKNGSYLFPTDASLGVPGLPQSGTGQVSIFCGINAPAFVGKHFGPFPYSTTIPIIKEKSIFRTVKNMGHPVAFANAYPPVFFDYIRSGKQRLSTTTLSCRLTDVKLKTVTDVRKGSGLTAEITNERWNLKLGYSLPVIKPATAAKRLLKIASKNAFTLYEYYLTDHMGHGRYDGEIPKTLNTLDEFLFSVLRYMDYDNLTLIICSDHGNFEDLSIKTHTMNPSITISAGLYSKALFENIKDISEIKGAILNYCK
jgi:2,3-bisphosphoglycerate-independent phosphoglycerate mutase